MGAKQKVTVDIKSLTGTTKGTEGISSAGVVQQQMQPVMSRAQTLDEVQSMKKSSQGGDDSAVTADANSNIALKQQHTENNSNNPNVQPLISKVNITFGTS